MSKNKNQHYVTASYMYNFTNEAQRIANKGRPKRKAKIFVFDLIKQEMKERPIEKIATESYFFSYQTDTGKYNHDLDDKLRPIENAADNAIEELHDTYEDLVKRKLTSVELKNDIIGRILDFVLWQMVRHPDALDSFKLECAEFIEQREIDNYSPKRMALDVVDNFIKDGGSEIRQLPEAKNKTIVCTSSDFAQFITTDKPFVRFNKKKNNGIGIKGTELYFPLAHNMFLFLHGEGGGKNFVIENDRKFMRNLNVFMAQQATRYLVGRNDRYLVRLHKSVANKRLWRQDPQ